MADKKKKVSRFKIFSKEPEIRTVDFREKNFPEIRTVDFREKKNIMETIHGETEEFPLQTYGLGWKEHKDKFDDDAAALEKHYKHEKLKIEHARALKYYTATNDDDDVKFPEGHTHSTDINDHLFATKNKPNNHGFIHQINHLDDSTSSIEAPHDFHVYSGLHVPPEPGKIHIHHGYMSSSLSPGIAHDFAKHDSNDESADNVRHILKLNIDKGSKHGRYIGTKSMNPEEHEFLIGRGKKIRIHPEPEIHEAKTYDNWTKKNRTHKIHIWHGEIVK